MDLVPNAAQLFLPRLEGLVACLACWHALVQAGRKQLLTLPGRTFFNSLSCSEELCCLIFFFFFFSWTCSTSPVGAASCCLIVHCWVVQCFHPWERCCTNCTEDISSCGPGQKALTALATGALPAWEVGVGGWVLVLSSCGAQISEMISLESNKKEKPCTEWRRTEIICVSRTLHHCSSSPFVKMVKWLYIVHDRKKVFLASLLAWHSLTCPHETLLGNRNNEVGPLWARPKCNNGDREANLLSCVCKWQTLLCTFKRITSVFWMWINC